MRTSVVRSRRRPPVATIAERNSATATPAAIAGLAATCGRAMVTERPLERPGARSATEDTPAEAGDGAAEVAGQRSAAGQRGHAEQHENGDHAGGKTGARRARGQSGGARGDRALPDLDRVAALGLGVLDGLVVG